MLTKIPSFLVKKTFDQVINNLQIDFRTLKVWFYDNFLILKSKNCHFMTLGNGNNLCDFSCDDTIFKNSLSEKILGLNIDNNLDFSDHISNICKTANQKLNALFRVSANLNSDKCTLLINSFIKSYFSYCPLIWMFRNRKSMKKVKKMQERYLRLMTNDYKLSYEELLDLTNEISPHQRCLNSLITQVYKCLNGLSSDIMNDTLAVSKHRYNTRPYNLFVTNRPKTDRFGRNSIPYRANQIWKLLPPRIKNSANLDSFKLKIKQWRCVKCPCTLCKIYLPNIGYL